MDKSETISTISVAMVEALAKMPVVKMNKTNPFLKNRYADLGAIIEASKEILTKHDLAISQICTSREGYIGVETVLLHKSGEWISSSMELPMSDEKGKSNAQVAGSIITYIRRYSLAAILGMYADEDVDGNNAKNNIPDKPEPPLIPKEVIKDAENPFDAMDLIEAYATVTRGVGGNVLEVIRDHAPDYKGEMNDIDEEIVIMIVEKLTGYNYKLGES